MLIFINIEHIWNDKIIEQGQLHCRDTGAFGIAIGSEESVLIVNALRDRFSSIVKGWLLNDPLFDHFLVGLGPLAGSPVGPVVISNYVWEWNRIVVIDLSLFMAHVGQRRFAKDVLKDGKYVWT